MPIVSVVIPCFNAQAFIRQTLDSVLTQTRVPDEILVVDDGSTDESAAIAETFGPPTRVIRQPNMGESVARNVGMAQSRGDWIAFLDADDIWLPSKVEAQLEAVAEGVSDVVCVHTNFEHIGARCDLNPNHQAALLGHYSPQVLLVEPLVHISTALVRRAVAPPFPDWTRRGEDMIFLAELSLRGRFVYLPQVLCQYRLHPAQQTRNASSMVEHHRSRWKGLHSMQANMPIEDFAAARAALVEDIANHARHARWKRRWAALDETVSYMSALDGFPSDHPFWRERTWPPVVYAAVDILRKGVAEGQRLLTRR